MTKIIVAFNNFKKQQKRKKEKKGTRGFFFIAFDVPILLLEELSQREISNTPSGMDPATFRLVGQCLNQLRYRVPQNL
jgi:hypothetical protein